MSPHMLTQCACFGVCCAAVGGCVCSAQVLRTRLALCVSAVAIHGVASGEWSTAVSDVASLLGDQSAESARVMCDVLSEIAEDGREPQLGLDATARSRVAGYLSSQLSSVLDRLHRTLNASGGHSALQKSALLCLCSWWKNVSWQPPTVLSHPVVDTAFAALAAVDLELAASQAIMELIRGVDDFCLPPCQHSAFDYWDEEEGELRHETVLSNGATPFTLAEEQIAAQQTIVHRVTALVPLYSQSMHTRSALHTSKRSATLHPLTRKTLVVF